MGYNDQCNDVNTNVARPTSKVFTAFACLIALVGCIAQSASLFMYNWRQSDKISYKYYFKGTERQHLVGPTSYGLGYISYDNGSNVVNWEQRIERSKTKGYNAIQYNSESEGFEIFAAMCPPYCQEAIATRITGYESIKSLNYIMNITIIICSVVVMCSIIWNVLFGGRTIICCACFVAAGTTGGVSYYWASSTDGIWNTIISKQQLPKPLLGNGFYLNIIGSGLYILAGVAFLIYMALQQFMYHRQLQKTLRMKYSELQENDMMTDTNLHYSYAQPNFQAGNGMMPPMMNTWNSPNNAVPFTQPGMQPNNSGFWRGTQGNFVPPGI